MGLHVKQVSMKWKEADWSRVTNVYLSQIKQLLLDGGFMSVIFSLARLRYFGF
jgi:hypothetical protein